MNREKMKVLMVVGPARTQKKDLSVVFLLPCVAIDIVSSNLDQGEVYDTM
jgi:hypothetical protein